MISSRLTVIKSEIKVLIRNNELPKILCLINNYLHETQGEYPSNEKVL